MLISFFQTIKVITKEKALKKLQKENEILKSGLNIRLKENTKEEHKETFKKVNEYINQLLLEFNNIHTLININNYNFDINTHIKNFMNKLNDIFLKGENAKNNNTNKFSTLKKYHYAKIENAFNKYRNETEEDEEYKNNIKQYILNKYSSILKRNISNVDSIVFAKTLNLGNGLYFVNNLIYFCEILNCKYFYLSQKYYSFMKKPIYNEEFGIKVIPYNSDNKDICQKDSTICLTDDIDFCVISRTFEDGHFFLPLRTYILKQELLSNMKLIETREEDLYINIRSGEDLFRHKGFCPREYFQPPLCFYQTIIENFNFTNIYIVSNGKENPVVEELLKLYKNIKYFHGALEEDTGLVLSAKNLVLPFSSFSLELVKLSDNLQNLFIYDSMIEKVSFHFTERHLRPCKFNRFIMYPSKEYTDIMYPYSQTKEQFERMINEKCYKKFKIIPSEFV